MAVFPVVLSTEPVDEQTEALLFRKPFFGLFEVGYFWYGYSVSCFFMFQWSMLPRRRAVPLLVDNEKELAMVGDYFSIFKLMANKLGYYMFFSIYFTCFLKYVRWLSLGEPASVYYWS